MKTDQLLFAFKRQATFEFKMDAQNLVHTYSLLMDIFVPDFLGPF